ncbi:hypothetical protein GGU10DRAFT_309389 [Lentinula aff. detonsa]|uniref:RNA-binding protein VTS1 n=1 Tax=Lentinula aff. detonsa TaxID=2804958 RepID=A0AA38KTM7_9AGAR|nr:hypothetical protein GGU10DRAFT_309389 [Lentinula aff. detonsa]
MLSTQPSNSTKKFPAELQPSSLHPSTASNTLEPRPNATGFVVPPSPRVGGTNGCEGIEQWFQDLQKYEATLGAMAVASEDIKFREELGTIEQWFKLLSESEQTASLYTLLQHARPNQVKFLSAVLQQMSDGTSAATAAVDTTANKAGRGLRPPSLNLPGTPVSSQFESPAAENDATGAKVKGSQTEQAQELLVKPSEETSWASMVATPQDLMFKKGSDASPNTAAAAATAPSAPSVPTAPTSVPTVPSGLVGPAAGMAAGLAAGMMNPFNMAMLNNMGFSTEAQILAVQLVMSGLVQPSGIQKPIQPKPHNRAANSSNNWRSPASARYPGSALRSSGLRSSGLRSALKAQTPKSAVSTNTLGSATTPKTEDIDPELLKDVPAWLKSLRLHKYNDCFMGMSWEDMIDLNEDQLEKKGVVALGARRRMIKTFENVKRKMGIEFTPTIPVTAGVEPSSSLPTMGEVSVPRSAAPVL